MAQAPTPTTERPGPWLPRLRSCIWWCLLDVAGDPPRGEATRDDHADVREALGVQRLADLPDQPRVDAGRDEIPHLTPERTVDHHAGGVQAHPPEPVPERSRAGQRGRH